ncbi:probable glucuronoxylan glucuronosyltransferase IRX7 [Olea europaea subsp. europaea]|uniref:Probable glucuronoxylan glucuronosyltransferase IRX7 n=1 Tax=Olea europaea subsp. europaea TaxID=158383 RepID=A0A8S0UY28_OLEEU|nr:probable glucuronoxylan glucuronosyltransferase IRX7 [Olea europaea subsp. europaea]
MDIRRLSIGRGACGSRRGRRLGIGRGAMDTPLDITMSRGFYVRMRLFHNPRYSRNPEKSFWYRFFKWILWFSLAFYFFSSFLITHTTPTTFISKAIVSPSKASRALIEESSFKSSTLQEPKSPQGLLKGMKVYIYDMPSKYNSDWLSNERCSNHLFASEVAIHKALMNSDVRTLEPRDADFFFVPVYVSCNFSKVNGFPDIGHARPLISSAVQYISTQLPFWNRSHGSDHVFVASHDFGSCFHTMEDVAMADGVPELLRNSIILQTFGVKYKHPCQDVENVVIPPYVSPEDVRSTLEKSPLTGRREIFAFFRGKMEVHPKNISGRFYSKRLRTVIWQKYGNNRRFYLRRHRLAGYQSEIANSIFCLAPLGWAPWSPRLVESVVLGCVPVIIADGIRLPFPSAVPWAEISLTVAEKDVKKLGKILEHVAATNLTTIQKNLWDPNVRTALLFNNPMEEGDATFQVLVALSEKLDRSHKRSKVLSQ